MISISSTAIWSNQMKTPIFIDVDFWWNSWSVDVHWCPLPFPWPPYAAISSHGLLLPRPAPKAQDISGSCVVQHIWSFINAKSCTHHGLELARPNWHTRHPNLNAGEVAPCYSSAFPIYKFIRVFSIYVYLQWDVFICKFWMFADLGSRDQVCCLWATNDGLSDMALVSDSWPFASNHSRFEMSWHITVLWYKSSRIANITRYYSNVVWLM